MLIQQNRFYWISDTSAVAHLNKTATLDGNLFTIIVITTVEKRMLLYTYILLSQWLQTRQWLHQCGSTSSSRSSPLSTRFPRILDSPWKSLNFFLNSRPWKSLEKGLVLGSPLFFPVTARVNTHVPYKSFILWTAVSHVLHEPGTDSLQYVICKLGVFFNF